MSGINLPTAKEYVEVGKDYAVRFERMALPAPTKIEEAAPTAIRRMVLVRKKIAPPPEPKKAEPKPEPKPEPKKAEPKPEPKKEEPKPEPKEEVKKLVRKNITPPEPKSEYVPGSPIDVGAVEGKRLRNEVHTKYNKFVTATTSGKSYSGKGSNKYTNAEITQAIIDMYIPGSPPTKKPAPAGNSRGGLIEAYENALMMKRYGKLYDPTGYYYRKNFPYLK